MTETKVIVFRGVHLAGKTTVCTNLIRRHPNWVYVAERLLPVPDTIRFGAVDDLHAAVRGELWWIANSLWKWVQLYDIVQRQRPPVILVERDLYDVLAYITVLVRQKSEVLGTKLSEVIGTVTELIDEYMHVPITGIIYMSCSPDEVVRRAVARNPEQASKWNEQDREYAAQLIEVYRDMYRQDTELGTRCIWYDTTRRSIEDTVRDIEDIIIRWTSEV